MEYVFMLVMVIFNVLLYLGYKVDLYNESPETWEALGAICRETGIVYNEQRITRRAFFYSNVVFGVIAYTILILIQWAVGS
jgi:hypothetical protein